MDRPPDAAAVAASLGCPLHGMDAPAALLLCLAVTGLRLLEHRLRFHAMPVTPEALLPVLFAGLAAACAHLLLRRLLGGMLPALSGALFFGLLQDGSPAVTAALLGYVLWRTAKRRGGGWIVLSVVCFAAGLLKERALLLLLPLYPIGYVCTRLSRRTGLGRSLALTLPLSLLGALGVAVLGWWMAGRGTPLEALRSFRFYEALWPALCGALRAAVTLPGRFSPTELALGALAVLTLPELLHGLCRGRDLRCAMILLLLVSAAALWALSGLFLLPRRWPWPSRGSGRGCATAARPSLRRSRPPCWRCAPSLPYFLCSDTGGYLMKIAIACDHGALALKEAVKAHLTARDMECVDFGTFTKDSCDYPDFARPAAEAVASGACERGIVMCTTGIGVSITANKVHGHPLRPAVRPGIRPPDARAQRREHDGPRRGLRRRAAGAGDRRHVP